MSFDKEIGFNPTIRPWERSYFQKFGVDPVEIDMKAMLPKESKEPEPKLLLPRPKSFEAVRALILDSSNAFMIPEQLYEDKYPLTSILLDTKIPTALNDRGLPTGEMYQNRHSLRFRFETNPFTGIVNQRDFNEKSALVGANVIGGCADRDERECELDINDTEKQGYERFINHCLGDGSPAFCSHIPYENLTCYAGYIAARTEFGFAVKHPEYPVMFVFEGCEDIFDTLHGNMSTATVEGLCEFEFEPKQMWGQLPHWIQTPEAFKYFLYSSMTAIRDSIHAAVPGAQVNHLSKAEIAQNHLIAEFGFERESLKTLGLRDYFREIAPHRFLEKKFTAIQYSLLQSETLDETLRDNMGDIANRGAKLHNTKLVNNEASLKPDHHLVGSGVRMLEFVRPVDTRTPIVSPALVA